MLANEYSFSYCDKMKKNKVYDLCVVGNGLAAQVFLWNLSSSDRKSQNFSIAQCFDEECAPACSLRASATVSLNGISEDVSPLGNDMREAYFLFEEFVNKNNPSGVIPVDRTVISTNEKEEQKLIRRYKRCDDIHSQLLKNVHKGVIYPSYLIKIDDYWQWFSDQTKKTVDQYPSLVKEIKKHEEGFEIVMKSNEILFAKKILLATGAYAKVFHHFFHEIVGDFELKTEIKAGSYLSKKIDLGDSSFYLSIDSHNILYRHQDQQLILGSTSTLGAFEAVPLEDLLKLFNKCKQFVSFDLGEFDSFQITTGLRHKAPKRMMDCRESPLEKNLFHINGFYKNGFSMCHLASKRMIKLIT